jgi:hypothetical protein
MVTKVVEEAYHTTMAITIEGNFLMIIWAVLDDITFVTVIIMRDNFSKVILMDLVNITILVAVSMKGNGYTEEKRVKGIYQHTDRHIRANGPIIWKWALANIPGKMEINIMEDLYPNLDKERGIICGKMDKKYKDGGEVIYLMVNQHFMPIKKSFRFYF